METLHAYAVERDGTVTANSALSSEARAILERMARCAYMIDRHREGIALNSWRLAELRSELAEIEGKR